MGSSAIETPAMAAVTPHAIASDRHSCRAANHRTPMNGVTLVSAISAQAPG